MDILNPVQLSAKNMGLKRLKKLYGDKLVFWGGGVDTQYTLPRGTEVEVSREVRENVSILKRDGGFVFNPVHNIQADVPPENILAAYRTAAGQ